MDIKILKDLFLTIERGNLLETSRSDYLQKDYGLSWSSQEWKSGDGEHDRSGKPEENSWDSLGKTLTLIVKNIFSAGVRILQGTERLFTIERGNLLSENLQGKAHFENFVMGSEITEFVNKVRDQVRIRQKRMSSIAENCAEHSIIWCSVYVYNIECSDIYGKEFFNLSRSVVKNHECLLP